MSDEKDLIKKRGSLKGRLTAFSTFLNGLNISSLSTTDITELQLRIGKITSMYDKYDEIQMKLECIVDDLDAQITERNEFESSYYKSLSKAQDILNKYSAEKENDSLASTYGKRKLVKLPTIQLPKFSGSYETWLEFHDTFSSLINSNSEIDEINKFHYLRASLEGSAAVVIQSIEFSAKNYEVAWKLLCDRFDNKRLLIQNHVTALFNIEPITKESSATLKRLIDNINKNLRALESLGEPIKHWDTLLIHIITNKLDVKTYREWEEYKGRLHKDDTISLECFNTFLRNRADLIETLELSRNSSQGHANLPTKHNTKHKTMVSIQENNSDSNHSSSVQGTRSCPMCKSHEHNLNGCSQFLALDNKSRLQVLPTFKVCFNCFSSGHFANRCKRQGCKVCKRKHHTMIHVTDLVSIKKPVTDSAPIQTADNIVKPGSATVTTTVPQSNMTLSASVARCGRSAQDEVLLSTALIKLYDANNCEHLARAVLDSGSTSCLITEKMFVKLNLPTTSINKSVLGINNVLTQIDRMCHLRIMSLDEQYSNSIRCFILPSITDCVPSGNIDLTDLNIPSDIVLADPNFHTPAEVDIIIGADIFWDILGSQKLKLGKGKPVLYDTKLGWLVSGPINGSYNTTLCSRVRCNFSKNCDIECSDNDNIQQQLARFWQLEEVNPKSSSLYSREENLCEDHFIKNTFRLDDGRFCVRIPLKENPKVLGESYQRAKHCFLALERRNKAHPTLGKMYADFMWEYHMLGHMSECNNIMSDSHYIPHHGVLRESSSTTKLRAVFNASSPTTSGISLNDIQMVGPQVQDDLLSILIRFRQHKYVLAADVEKMYRQVVVHPDDRYLQQILWRFNSTDELKTFKLNTVTYGTASAPFLATRCLKQLGIDCKNSKIAEIITRDFYVDDLLTGGSTIEEVLDIRHEVTSTLASACMPLRKWKSNEHRLTGESSQSSSFDLNIGTTEPSKTLGLSWMTEPDQLCFPIGSTTSYAYSKRGILSVIAQIFDPLGLLAPCVIRMKLILQKLWIEKISWDDKLSQEISRLWADILSSLPVLNNIRISRHVICDNVDYIEMHIFTDASERAYGACLYMRSVSYTGNCLVRLLLAKSRVAPVKPTTVPRLELCGALVGVRLFEKAFSSLRLKVKNVTFWTDSTIVLGWLKMLPCKLQPFVRNRVAEILEKTHNYKWRHVSTDVNPADHITRGVDFDSFQSLDNWWSGPQFLKLDESHWPSNMPKKEILLPETRHISLQTNVSQSLDCKNLIDFNRFSNFVRLKRSVAYVLRFVNRCKRCPITEMYLTHEELQTALNLIIKISQSESFPEYRLLLKKQSLPQKSPLIKLNVFLDENEIMRVGGRLENSNFSFDKKHPMLLQSTHRFTKLLFDNEHKNLMHAGSQLLLATIRERYWPIGGRNLAKKCCHQCVRCSRLKAQVVAPLMGNLPQNRVTPGGYPFDCVGVDYAGPLAAVSRQGRGSRVVKVYIAIFICFTTKAVHLELVGDLTSHSYMLALRRFISRRGKPQSIYSDNGTSFVGAYNELSKFLKSHCNSLGESVANEGIKFHFIPAYAPHFGGLWEAGVKSTKYHLVRVLGNCHLTYEELNTTLIQIEAILNSRPLTPLSSDPEDLTHLTPGHFLIGRSLTALPERNYNEDSSNHLTRFQRIGQLRLHFWARWSKEYVAELQTRTKWRTNNEPLKLNTLVVLKEDNLPPMKWRLGRVVAVYPGSDGISRVADIRTSNGVVRRAFSKICPLPEVST